MLYYYWRGDINTENLLNPLPMLKKFHFAWIVISSEFNESNKLAQTSLFLVWKQRA